MKLLGNRAIGVPLTNFPYIKKGIIHIPISMAEPGKSTIQPTLIPVRIILIGEKFIYKNEVKVGDIVYFSRYFGDELSTIRELVNEPKSKLYSGDDAMAFESCIQ